MAVKCSDVQSRKWEARAEAVGDDVVVVASRPLRSWVLGDLLDHLRVVVAGEAALARVLTRADR